MRKNVVRRLTPAFPVATLAFCLLGGATGNSSAVMASEPSLPDVNLPNATVGPTNNPVSELPPPPAAITTVTQKSLPSVIAKTVKTMPPKAVVLQVATPPVSEPRSPQDTVTQSDTTTQPIAGAGESLRAAAKRLNLAMPLPQGRIVVTKSQRRLDVYNGEVLLKSYHVALGSNPVGHKKQQGDGRTPEGQFYICTRNSKTSAFHIFLGLSYPALPDATRAVKSKAISPREFQIIRQRLASRSAPLWETRLGGWVGIHGGTDASFAKRTMKARKSRDWTAGCVALTNKEIEDLHAATRIGTPVLVQP